MKFRCQLVLLILLLHVVSVLADSDADYQQGMAFAKEHRWKEARKAFLNGQRNSPTDKRFPAELAGIAFQQHQYGLAKSYLHRSLKLDPSDGYVLDFLGTIYFLEENLEAALLHWNQIGRPQIENIKVSAQPRVHPVLLDRAFTFSPASLLKFSQLQESKARLNLLEIFPRYSFELVARPDRKFDLIFHALEKNGWGNTTLEALLSLFRGLPYLTIYPEFYNWKGAAINFSSLARWDSDKRRIFASVSGPISSNPKYRFRFDLDGRRENWHITALSENFRLESVRASFQMESVLNAQWSLENSASFSDTELQGTNVFHEGREANSKITLIHQYEFPEERLRVRSFVGVGIGRLFHGSSDLYSQLEGGSGLTFRALALSVSLGKSFGTIPFDREYMLGVEQDNDLWLRAHNGFRKKKGALPLGADFVLINWEADKLLYRHPFFQWKAGPFIDVGKTYDSSLYLGSHKWLLDTGLQAKLRIMNSLTTVLVVGKNLRTGSTTVYINITR